MGWLFELICPLYPTFCDQVDDLMILANHFCRLTKHDRDKILCSKTRSHAEGIHALVNALDSKCQSVSELLGALREENYIDLAALLEKEYIKQHPDKPITSSQSPSMSHQGQRIIKPSQTAGGSSSSAFARQVTINNINSGPLMVQFGEENEAHIHGSVPISPLDSAYDSLETTNAFVEVVTEDDPLSKPTSNNYAENCGDRVQNSGKVVTNAGNDGNDSTNGEIIFCHITSENDLPSARVLAAGSSEKNETAGCLIGRKDSYSENDIVLSQNSASSRAEGPCSTNVSGERHDTDDTMKSSRSTCGETSKLLDISADPSNNGRVFQKAIVVNRHLENSENASTDLKKVIAVERSEFGKTSAIGSKIGSTPKSTLGLKNGSDSQLQCVVGSKIGASSDKTTSNQRSMTGEGKSASHEMKNVSSGAVWDHDLSAAEVQDLTVLKQFGVAPHSYNTESSEDEETDLKQVVPAGLESGGQAIKDDDSQKHMHLDDSMELKVQPDILVGQIVQVENSITVSPEEKTVSGEKIVESQSSEVGRERSTDNHDAEAVEVGLQIDFMDNKRSDINAASDCVVEVHSDNLDGELAHEDEGFVPQTTQLRGTYQIKAEIIFKAFVEAVWQAL